jgi:hypothetical protein
MPRSLRGDGRAAGRIADIIAAWAEARPSGNGERA